MIIHEKFKETAMRLGMSNDVIDRLCVTHIEVESVNCDYETLTLKSGVEAEMVRVHYVIRKEMIYEYAFESGNAEGS
ncbi:conserved protein of unknown function [Shewanella benthica]|uniref:Uncharacterized protein n=1 Tax=Shewanella benthica TaxID=43661 RepID=A0A330LVQ9_9GAMM|nr:conserved protein of unknown function [Shewanella benthica]